MSTLSSSHQSLKSENDEPGFNPLDILSQTGFVTYEWKVAEDRMRWSSGAHKLFNLPETENIDSARAYTRIISSEASTSQIEVALNLASRDTGEGAPFNVEYPLSTKRLNAEGLEEGIWVEDCGRVFANEQGMPDKVIGTVRVINARRDREHALERMSHYDSGTGLLNRDRLSELLAEDYDRVAREHGSGAFIIIGIEHMNLINEMYGFGVGNEIVREAGKRIETVMRLNDSIARLAGTKMALILRDCTEGEMLIACERFLNALRDEVITTSAGPVSLTVNIGGVVYPSGAREAKDIMGSAGAALDEARRAPIPTIQVYQPAVDLALTRQKNAFVAQEVVEAMEARRMRLAYQPIVSAKSHRVAFHEALIRMVDRSGKLVEAGSFVGIASRLGLIRRVDFSAMELAVETLNTYPEAVLSLNVTNETAVDPEWLSTLATSIANNPDIAPRLIVEITESHAAENLDESIRFVRTIQDLGCRVAIDDFGAGYTSFANLKHLPVDIIKIDGMYVDDLANSIENQVFIKSLLELAKTFSMEVVVEWVSDDETAQLLKEWGVDYLQGQSFGAALVTTPWNSKPEQADNDVQQAAG
jgi:diguanylate cyclase (GGDEF)-like protein